MRKRKHKLVLRLLLYSALAGLILYALLPWILPMGLVKRKLTAQIERDFGRPVQIGEVTVSWGGGVQIRDLVIQRKRTYGAGELLRVSRLHTSFTPLQMLHSGMDVVLMEDVDFYVVATKEDLNVIDLPPLEMSQLIVDKATVHFETHLEGEISKVIFDVGSAVIDNDKATDAFAWEFSAHQLGRSEPTIVSRGQIGRFANQPGEQTQQDIWISVRDMDLAAFRLDRWINLGLKGGEESLPAVRSLVSSIKGRCSAQVNLQLSENQEMSGEGWFEFTDLEITGRTGNEKAELWSAMHALSGRFEVPQYDPITDLSCVSKLEIQGPGFLLKGQGRYDPREGVDPNIYIAVNEGRVKPEVLADAFPFLATKSRAGFLGQGQLRFQTEFHAAKRTESGWLALDGTDWGFEIGGVKKPAGEPLQLELRSELNHDTEVLALTVNNLQWASLKGNGKLTLPDWHKFTSREPRTDPEQDLRRILRLLAQGSTPSEMQANITIGDLSELKPYLDSRLGRRADLILAGPAQAEIEARGGKSGQDFALNLRLPSEARCVWSDAGRVVWQKNKGKDFRLECSGRWKGQEPTIENAHLRSSLGAGKLSFGPGRLVFRDDVIHVAGTGLHSGASSTHLPSTVAAATDITGYLQSPLLTQVNGRWQIKGISDWLIALPIFKNELTKQGVDMQGSLQGDLTYRYDANQNLEWSDQIDFTDLEIRVYSEETEHAVEFPLGRRSLIFQKPVGEIGKVSVSARENRLNHMIDYHVQGQIGAMEARGDGQAVRLVSAEAGRGPVRNRHWDVEADIHKLQDVPRYFGALFDKQGWCEQEGYGLGDLQGQIHLQGQWHIGELAESIQFTIDAAKSGFLLTQKTDRDAKEPLWHKRPDNPLTITGELTITEKDGLIGTLIGMPGTRSPSRLAKIKTLHVEAAGLSADGSGDVIYELSGDADKNWLQTCRQIKLDLQGDLDHDGALGQEVPLFAELQRQVGLEGRTHLEGSLEWNREQKRLQCSGAADLTQTAAAFTWIVDPNEPEPIRITKPAGDNLLFAFALRTPDRYDVLDLDKMQVQFGKNTITLSGQLRGIRWPDRPNLESPSPPGANPFLLENLPAKEADWQLHVQAPELHHLAKWLSPLRKIALAGQLEAEVNLFQQFEPTVTTFFKPSRMTGALRWEMERWPMECRIRDMELSSARLVVPEATIRIGDNHLTLVTDVTEPIISRKGFVHELQQPKGRIDVISGKLDLDDLQEFLNAWQVQSFAAQFVPEAKPTRDSSAAFRYEDIRDFLSTLQRCELTGMCEFGNLSFTDPANAVRMDLDKVLGRYEITDGMFQMQFAAGLGGGAVEGTIRCDLKAETPIISYAQTARQLQANEMLRGIVESEFPGLEVTGTISEKKEFTGDLYQILETNQGWQGKGVTQCSQGVLFGPGGPGWMLRVFPGLKLVEYDWREFTNEYELSSDGTKQNKILFKGETYNIYIDGESKPIQDAALYQSMVEALEADLQANREKLKALHQGELEVSEEKARRLRILTTGLEQLWQKHQAGQTLRAFQADYNVGGLISAGGGKKFQKPREILRIPIFRTRSYIVERYMVGIKTSNIAIGPLGR